MRRGPIPENSLWYFFYDDPSRVVFMQVVATQVPGASMDAAGFVQDVNNVLVRYPHGVWTPTQYTNSNHLHLMVHRDTYTEGPLFIGELWRYDQLVQLSTVWKTYVNQYIEETPWVR